MKTRRHQGAFRARLSGQESDSLDNVSTAAPFAALAATTSSMIHTQRVVSLMWLDIGSEIAGHASRSIDFALRSLTPTSLNGRPVDAAARELLASQLSLTRHVIERVAETGRDIADVWGRFPDRVATTDSKAATLD
jgi:hypothetical protein